VRLEASLIDTRATTRSLGDGSRLRLCSAKQLIGEPRCCVVKVNVQGGVDVQVQVNVNAI